MPRFDHGQFLATPGALTRADEHGIKVPDLLERHLRGDWGDVDDHDGAMNEAALVSGARLLSVYGEGDRKLYIITEAVGLDGKRACTTVLRPEDY